MYHSAVIWHVAKKVYHIVFKGCKPTVSLRIVSTPFAMEYSVQKSWWDGFVGRARKEGSVASLSTLIGQVAWWKTPLLTPPLPLPTATSLQSDAPIPASLPIPCSSQPVTPSWCPQHSAAHSSAQRRSRHPPHIKVKLPAVAVTCTGNRHSPR